MAIQFIDLCSGIGGFHSGLMATGHFMCVGHAEIDQNRIIESRFFVSEDNYDTYKDAQEHMDEKYISFDCLMEDVFGDG